MGSKRSTYTAQDMQRFADQHRRGYGASGNNNSRLTAVSPERNVEMGSMRSNRRVSAPGQQPHDARNSGAAGDGRLDKEMEHRAAGRDRRRERYTGRLEADDSAASFRC